MTRNQMTTTSAPALAAAFFATMSLTFATSAFAHTHINMTPASSNEGAQLAITHFGSHGAVAIVSANDRLELWQHGEIYTVTADTLMTTGDHAGMLRGNIFNFTADNATDLNASDGPIGYEIVDVRRIDDDATTQVVWRFLGPNGNPESNGHTLRWANSTASTAAGRSFLHNVGDHVHGSRGNPDSGFFLFTQELGLYEITIRAWDTTGYFAASEPVSFQLNAIPEPTSAMLVLTGCAALLALRRRSRLKCVKAL